MRLDIITVQYFKCLANEIGIPYQTRYICAIVLEQAKNFLCIGSLRYKQ